MSIQLDNDDWLGVYYILLQLGLALIVSIIGVNHVRMTMRKQSKIDNGKHSGRLQYSQKSFWKLWIRIAWKLRSIYGSFFVHIFDFTTDLLVILKWWNEDSDGDINTRTLAINSLIVIGIYKIISTYIFWLKEKDIIRCILQFLDILLFQEIFAAHKSISNKIIFFANNHNHNQNINDKENKNSNKSDKKDDAGIFIFIFVFIFIFFEGVTLCLIEMNHVCF